MKLLFKTIVFAFTLTITVVSVAKEKTVNFSVKNMDCPSCIYIIQSSLEKVNGVRNVEMSSWKRTATVTFEDTTADVATLIAAPEKYGYVLTAAEPTQSKTSKKTDNNSLVTRNDPADSNNGLFGWLENLFSSGK